MSKHTETGSRFGFHSNCGGDCVFSLLARVQPHNLIQQLASLKRIGAQEMKEEGE